MSESQILRFPKMGMDKGIAWYCLGMDKGLFKPIHRGGRGFAYHYHHYNYHSSSPLSLS